MTPQEHARDLMLRLSAIKIESPDDLAGLLVHSFTSAIGEERKRCAEIVQAAREGEIDGDFRSIKYLIENP